MKRSVAKIKSRVRRKLEGSVACKVLDKDSTITFIKGKKNLITVKCYASNFQELLEIFFQSILINRKTNYLNIFCLFFIY